MGFIAGIALLLVIQQKIAPFLLDPRALLL
jgi:hypothetical protein